jgi:hypothetical protein
VFGIGGGGFGGWSKAKRQLDQRLLEARQEAFGKKAQPVPKRRLHDIRRTVATGIADIGIQPHVIEAVLNHISRNLILSSPSVPSRHVTMRKTIPGLGLSGSKCPLSCAEISFHECQRAA